MAESNPKPMSMEAFRAKKAASSTFDKPTASSSSKSNPSDSSSNSTQTRPASASRTNSSKRSASSENLAGDRYGPGLDPRQNKVKQIREKQADERRRKNEERRAAFEERKKKKEEEEKERWAALKEQAARHSVSKASSSTSTSALKPGSGRRLPSVPSDGAAKRPGTAVESPSRPSSLPRPLNRPVSVNLAKSPSRHNADSLSGGPTPKQSPATTPSSLQPKPSLAGSKSVSAGNLNSTTGRRSNGGSAQPRPSSGTKGRGRTSSHTSSQTLEKPRSRNSMSHESLLLPGGKLTKSHSTSSLHKVGQHKPAGDKTPKAETKPKAGVTDEATAKQALAERRKKAREEAERQAALDKERQEAERLKREEEERIRAEEEAKEEARMRELAELLRKQEEERLRLAAEEKERKDREEAERAAAEKKRKEEEEQRAREEEERKALEDEERRKQEEAERLERKRRVEQIMSRTRQTASPTATEETKEHTDPDDTKRKVNEILQKVKGVSGSVNTLISSDDNISVSIGEAGQEYTDELRTDETECQMNNTSGGSEQSIDVPDYSLDRVDSDAINHTNGINSSVVDSDGDSLSENVLSSSPTVIGTPQESNYVAISSSSTNHDLLKENVFFQCEEESSVMIDKENYAVNGTDQGLETEKVLNGESTLASS